MLRILGVIVLAMAAAGPVQAGKFTTKYIYYPVSGSTAASLHRTLAVPTGFFSRERSYANIVMKPNIRGVFVPGKRCRTRGFAIDAAFTVRLPRARKGASIPKGLRRKLNKFISFAKRHELTHRRIFIGCIRRAERRIRAVRVRSCDRYGTRIGQILKKEVATCQRLNARFDRSERSRLNRHPLIRAVFRQAVRRKTVRTRRSTARVRTNFN